MCEFYNFVAEKLTLLQAAAQAYVFFIAGFETSSSVATHCLYELALNPHVQEQVHAEIDEVLRSPDGLTYESLGNMEFLNMVFQGTNFSSFYIKRSKVVCVIIMKEHHKNTY